jgi:hypothetical protein
MFRLGATAGGKMNSTGKGILFGWMSGSWTQKRRDRFGWRPLWLGAELLWLRVSWLREADA